MPKSFLRQGRAFARSQVINIDNGSGTTIDEVLLNSGPTGIRLLRAYALYNEATQTVAAGNFKLGVAVGGATLVAATAYTNDQAIGVKTEGVVLVDVVAPNTTLWVRHTGIAATATGTAFICVEYVFDE
jgi:hypothetical protein